MRFYGAYTSVTATGTVRRMEEQKSRKMTDARTGTWVSIILFRMSLRIHKEYIFVAAANLSDFH